MENPTRSFGITVALVVTALHGVTTGLLAVLGVAALGTVAGAGVLVVGAVWVVVGLWSRPSRPRRSTP